jgi:alkylhydroperoxidase family enzyme
VTAVDDLDPTALRDLVPEPMAAWDRVLAGAAPVEARAAGRRLRPLVAALLGAPAAGAAPEAAAAAGWRAEPELPAGDRAVLELAEQFVLDVGSVSEDQRRAALAALGADAFGTVQLLYVLDLGTRMDGAWRQLFGTEPARTAAEATDLWAELESFMAAVARLRRLDPTTTEIVRLRGARAHRCRLCQSLRNVRAARAGADEALYDQIDHYETSALADRHRCALRLVDAMLWQPCAYPAAVRDDVRSTFSDAEAAELVLDVARNAANKIAVAFGADDPHVTDGLEFYDVDDRGELVYALDPPD